MKNVNTGQAIVGSSRANGTRQKNDYYPTPKYVTQDLLNREKFEGTVWEVACGNGNISEVLKFNEYSTYSTDVINYGYNDATIDFLKYDGEKLDNIITNAPYKYGLEFVQKAKEYAKKKIAMLFKTAFLESEKRFQMFQDKDFPLEYVYQFSYRVTIYKNGEKMKNKGMASYAWFVWNKNYVGEPKLRWISNQDITIINKYDWT